MVKRIFAVLAAVVALNMFSVEALGRIAPMQDELLEVHYRRKHGKNAYYGQG